MAHKTLVDGVSYDITGGKTLINGTSYSIKNGKSMMDGTVYDINLINLPPVGTALNDCTWEQIRAISDAGLASTYFRVDDRKAVYLNGTVGTLSLNGTYYCYIIGIDHNSSYEGANRIHFQFAFSALNGGYNLAFVTGETTGFCMNSSASNSGGWESSAMRIDYCSAFQNTLPTDLVSVLKPVTKYTDNTGSSSGNTSATVTATTDTLFLLSEFEVYGEIVRANSTEAFKQERYAYYQNRSTVQRANFKYSHFEPNRMIAVGWWLRSPVRNAYDKFVLASSDGYYGQVSFDGANRLYGLAPAFCV